MRRRYFNIAFVVVVVSLVVQGWTIAAAARLTGVARRDQAPEIQRIDIDLPGQLDAELVGYPVLQKSPAARHRALPDWVRPVLIVRDGKIFEPSEAGPPLVGDYGYYLAPTQRLNRLDRFFAVDGTTVDLDRHGRIPVRCAPERGDIAALYGHRGGAGRSRRNDPGLLRQPPGRNPAGGRQPAPRQRPAHRAQRAGRKVTLAGLLLEAEPEDDEAGTKLSVRLRKLARRTLARVRALAERGEG